tara:strand:- start:340 stop:528 length:189 start_codon:yes stop_codon:yes gene_type:complete
MYHVITYNKIRRSINKSSNEYQMYSILKWITLFETTFGNKEDANYLRKLAVAKLNDFSSFEN